MAGRNKYHARKVAVGGRVYDSTHEARRGQELRLLERAGRISDLREQVVFHLIPSQWETFPRYGKRGQRLQDGRRCLERAVDYTADFVYTDASGGLVVEDAKSPATRTDDYVIRRKLMLWIHGIKIEEV